MRGVAKPAESLVVFFYALRQYAVDALREGRFPLWNPDIFLGSPFFANALRNGSGCGLRLSH